VAQRAHQVRQSQLGAAESNESTRDPDEEADERVQRDATGHGLHTTA